MNNICILGGTGLLGSAIVDVFGSHFPDSNILAPGREELDVTSTEALRLYLTQNHPTVVVNCVGYTSVDLPETDTEAKALCHKLNTKLVEDLVILTNELESKLVHFSTDYVFSGTNSDGYAEDAKPEEPLSSYGETKKLAEEAILSTSKNYFLIRTSWLFGPGKKNFVTTMLSLADKLPELKVVNDEHGKPTYTVDIAIRLAEMLAQNVESGIYHLVNEGDTTWYEFAKNIFTMFNKEVKVSAVTAEEFDRPAKRPMFSSLVCTKLPKMRNHLEALKVYKDSLN